MNKKSPRVRQVLFILVALLIVGFLTSFSYGSENSRRSKGQTVYVPLYSNIYTGDRMIAWQLSAMLSIRNTSPTQPISITRVDYYDLDGKLVRKHVEEPKKINPMASMNFFVMSSDTAGGWGANFVVVWKSEKEVSQPIIQSLMTGTRGNHSVSFISLGEVID